MKDEEKRYIIVSDTMGAFLGTHLSSLFGEDSKMFVLFAKTDIFGIYKAASFETKEEAKIYIKDYLSKRFDDLKILEIYTEDKYISVVHLIKAGYSEYTHMMVDNLPMISEDYH